MFKSDFQGGPSFEILTSQGKSPEKNWKLSSRVQVKKTYSADLKGYCYHIENGKLSLPFDDKIHVYLFQPFLLFQLYVHQGGSISIEFSVHDLQNQNRRIFMSTSNREVKVTALHASMPFPTIKTSTWTNLCIDVPSILSNTFKGASFRSIGAMSIHGTFRLRKVATLKSRPASTDDLPDISMIFRKSCAEVVPRVLEMPGSVRSVTVVIGRDDVNSFRLVAKKANLNPPIMTHPHIAFGRGGHKPPTPTLKSASSYESISLKQPLPPIVPKDEVVEEIMKRVESKEKVGRLEEMGMFESSHTLVQPDQDTKQDTKVDSEEQDSKLDIQIDNREPTIQETSPEEPINYNDPSSNQTEEESNPKQSTDPNENKPQQQEAERYSPITQLEREYTLFLESSKESTYTHTLLPHALLESLSRETAQIANPVPLEREVQESVLFFKNGGRRLGIEEEEEEGGEVVPGMVEKMVGYAPPAAEDDVAGWSLPGAMNTLRLSSSSRYYSQSDRQEEDDLEDETRDMYIFTEDGEKQMI